MNTYRVEITYLIGRMDFADQIELQAESEVHARMRGINSILRLFQDVECIDSEIIAA